jgi:zinc-ribbon domain
MFCSQCGKSNAEHAKFCTHCGVAIADQSSVPVMDAVAEQLDSAPISPQRNQVAIPPGVEGWSWGAFIFGWFWAVCNKTWIGLLALVPGLGFIMHIILGFKGREWAWQNDQWDNLEHFQRVQRRWSQWGIGIVLGIIGLMFLGLILSTATFSYFLETPSSAVRT